MRRIWLDHALSTAPADRAAAEHAITELYALVDRPPPRFQWAESPHAAAKVAGPGAVIRFDGPLGTEQRIAALVAALRERMGRMIDESLSPVDFEVHSVLRQVVRDNIAGLIRGTLDQSVGLFWYGQHDVAWIARFDAARRTGRVRFSPGELAQWELWATLARSCGWWWPREDVCVIADRPAMLRTEPLVDSQHDELRPHCGDGPAVEFRDGTTIHAWHGTRVPAWVIENPTAERISVEPNVEVRRCAIEKIGWNTFLGMAGLSSVGQADDPANDGCELHLYDLPWSTHDRLLLAINGSVERDGTRRQYGLYVPAWFDDPVDAAGWTYGLTGPQYATLARRT